LAVTFLAVAFAVLLFLLYAFVKGDADLALKTTISFILGALCSGLAGWVGMYVSIRANVRAAFAATRSLDRALKLALRGGAVSGLSVVALSLLGVGGLFLAFGGMGSEEAARKVPFLIVGYGFGASFVALFAQLGGGIYTKAAVEHHSGCVILPPAQGTWSSLRTAERKSRTSNGLSRMTAAPSRVASTCVGWSPKAVIRMTGVAQSRHRSLPSTSSPLTTGIRRSVMIRSTGSPSAGWRTSVSTQRANSAPSRASITSQPSARRALASN